MIEVVGDLWSEIGKADLLLVTTNAFVKKDGTLVMGRGAAREAAIRYPALPERLGQYLRQSGQEMKNYGIALAGISDGKTHLGAFQVKRGWNEWADVELIKHSTRMLMDAWVPLFERIAMNFPGIGNGRLARERVLPIIDVLPDNVFVYRR